MDKVETLDTLLIKKSQIRARARVQFTYTKKPNVETKSMHKELPTFAIVTFIQKRDKCYFLAILFDLNTLLLLDQRNGKE